MDFLHGERRDTKVQLLSTKKISGELILDSRLVDTAGILFDRTKSTIECPSSGLDLDAARLKGYWTGLGIFNGSKITVQHGAVVSTNGVAVSATSKLQFTAQGNQQAIQAPHNWLYRFYANPLGIIPGFFSPRMWGSVFRAPKELRGYADQVLVN